MRDQGSGVEKEYPYSWDGDKNITLGGSLVSPNLTGTPTTTTASAGDNSTQIATTAFVQNSLDTIKSGLPLSGGVS